VRISKAALAALPLRASAAGTTESHMDHLPQLVMDRCLSGSDVLPRFVAANFEGGRHVEAETITMPRRGFGLRPITIMAVSDRVMYEALVDALSASLPSPSRGPGSWLVFDDFGMPGSSATDEYVVSIDIASCYEYIDHRLLRSELIIHSMQVERVDALMALLLELCGRPIGLPQMLASSDRLGDTYLHAIERALARNGHRLLRFADDFKVLASTWADANAVVEEAADIARRFGLVLSTEKTRIRKTSTLVATRVAAETLVQDYFELAKEGFEGLDWIIGSYGEIDEIESELDDDEAQQDAFLTILSDWIKLPEEQLSVHARLVGRAISILHSAPTRLSDDVITAVVYKEPIRLEAICAYIRSRSESDANWTTLLALVRMERQAPWAKLWLLHTAGEIERGVGQRRTKFGVGHESSFGTNTK
jgi:RNA-directed DNA polymerase